MNTGKLWRVVAILDEYRIVVNGGRGELNLGDKLEVIDHSIELRDPDSGQVLGSVVYPKARLEVIQLEDKLAVARSADTETVEQPGILSTWKSLGLEPYTIRRKLKIRPEDAIGGWGPAGEKAILVGDSVRRV